MTNQSDRLLIQVSKQQVGDLLKVEEETLATGFSKNILHSRPGIFNA